MQNPVWGDYLPHYYIVYSTAWLVLTVALLYVLHRAGVLFLDEQYGSNPGQARAIGRLLDIGYCLICVGYFTLTVQTVMPTNSRAEITQILTIKVGLYLLLLGALHVFNLLLLALFRRPAPAHPAAS